MSSRRRDSTSILIPSGSSNGPVLLVEDDSVFAMIMRRRLEVHGYRVEVARDGIEALDAMREVEPDVVITDIRMPRMGGFELCEAIRADKNLRFIYVILISATSDKKTKVKSLEIGADDFLAKECENDELFARVQAGMRIRSLQRALLQQAAIDGMTGLSNRTHFFDRMTAVMKRAAETRTPTSLAMIDVDKLKEINDTYGHVVGDEAIRRVARALTKATRASDVVARYGGDEFAAIFVDASEREAEIAMMRVEAELAKSPIDQDGTLISLQISWGVSTVDLPNAKSADDVIKTADRRLYKMKHLHHEMLKEATRAEKAARKKKTGKTSVRDVG